MEPAAPLEVLLETAAPPADTTDFTDVRGGNPPLALARRYGGPLAIPLRRDRPTLIANFVESLDGVVAVLGGPRGGGSDISGGSEPDRFVMALLRSLADVVIVGAGTVRAEPRHEWTPRGVAPGWATACAAWRAELGLAPQPTTLVVTSSGNLPPDHRGLGLADVPVVIAATSRGAARLARDGTPGGARVEVTGDGPTVEPAALLALLHRLGTRLALCEGGPHLLADLLAADAIDELFLTLAPQLLGRTASGGRWSLVEGRRWNPGEAPWWSVRSVRRERGHLFLRYGFAGRGGAATP